MSKASGNGAGSSVSDSASEDSWHSALEDLPSASAIDDREVPLQEERKADLKRDEVLPKHPTDLEEEVTGMRRFADPEDSVPTHNAHPFTGESTDTSQNDAAMFFAGVEPRGVLTMLGAQSPESPSNQSDSHQGTGSEDPSLPAGGLVTELAHDILTGKPHDDYRRASEQLAEEHVTLHKRIQVLEKRIQELEEQRKIHPLDAGRRDKLAREIENLTEEKNKLEKEVEQLKQTKDQLVKNAVPKKAQKLVKSYVASSSHDGNECLACEIKKDRQKCWKCEHRNTSHGCRSCESCKRFDGKKGQKNCDNCDHEKSEHGCKACESCKQFSPLVIADSHGYTKAALKEMCDGDEYRIFDGKQSQSKNPTNCCHRQLCSKCENGTANAEDSFVKCLKSVRKNPNEYHHRNHQNPAPVSGHEPVLIKSVHADLLHVFSYRALPQSTDLGHYGECCGCLSHYPHILRWVVRARECVMHSKWKDRDPAVDNEFIDPADAGMLFHLKLSDPPSSHLTEYPVILKVEYETGQWMPMIYAQIPPFYWAFPLVEDQHVPDEFPEQASTARQLSKYCPQAVEVARALTPHFPTLVDDINAKLLEKRAEFLHQETKDQKVTKWRDSLCKEEQDIESKIEELHSQELLNEMEEKALKDDWKKWKEDYLSKKPQKSDPMSRKPLDEQVEQVEAQKKQLEERQRQFDRTKSKYRATLEETITRKLTIQSKIAGKSKLGMLIYYLPDCCLDIPKKS